MRKYLTVGYKVTIGRGIRARPYMGMQIASREAMFLNVGSGGLGTWGLAGSLVEVLVPDFNKLQVIKVASLPSTITGHPDWPMSHNEGRMLVIPRSEVATIRYSFWTTFNFETFDQQLFRLELFLFMRGRSTRFLLENGWSWK